MKNIREKGISSWGKMMRLIVALLATTGILAFAASSVLAQENPDRIVMGEDLTITEGETVRGDVSVTNGDLLVRGDVRGDVFVLNGQTSIEGVVSGDVVVTGGNVKLGPQSVVEGDVMALGGEIRREQGATVQGEVHAGKFDWLGDDWTQGILQPDLSDAPSSSFGPRGVFGNMLGLFGRGMFSLLLLGLGLGIAALLPARISVASATLEAEPTPSLVVGLITAFLLPPVVGVVAVVLVISLIGILLLPVLMAALVAALLFGLVAVSAWIGRLIYDGMHHTHTPQTTGNHLFVQALIGMSILLGATLVPTMLLPNAVTPLMLALLYFASCVGIGSAILSKFGTLAPPNHRYRHAPAHSAPTSAVHIMSPPPDATPPAS